MKWVTRKDLAGRIACAWLIRRFLDPKMACFFREEKACLALSAVGNRTFDLPHHPELKFNPHEGLSTFEVLVTEPRRPRPKRLGKIVHAAERRGAVRGVNDLSEALRGPGFVEE